MCCIRVLAACSIDVEFELVCTDLRKIVVEIVVKLVELVLDWLRVSSGTWVEITHLTVFIFLLLVCSNDG